MNRKNLVHHICAVIRIVTKLDYGKGCQSECVDLFGASDIIVTGNEP